MSQWYMLVLIITNVLNVISTVPDRPHIIFILVDDLGWNDVGFHGSGQIPTPNIDALAYSGLILHQYYVTPICTPSRSALMTGKYPIHTGMQHGVLKGAEPRGLPLTEKLLPEYLRELGYRTHIVGKWHLGFYKKEYTPTFRGFESHLGYWTGHHDYYDHTAVEEPYWGFDMRRNMKPAWDLHGQYSTDVFSKEAVKLINNHNVSEPMFLFLAHAAVHSANPYNPLPAADEIVDKIKIPEYKRRRFAAIANIMDSSVGKVVEALGKKNMLENSIIVVSTDNGGPAQGFNFNAASNWPLRGVKDTLFEGGVRGVGLIWSKHLNNPGRISNQTLHITDWLPTLLSAAGGYPNNSRNIDGLDVWNALKKNTQSPRKIILHNIDNIKNISAITVGDWKLIKGSSYNGKWDQWYGPSGRDYDYDLNSIINTCPVAKALNKLGLKLNSKKILVLRSMATINCDLEMVSKSPCNPMNSSCLINIRQDPCEKQNLASKFPTIVKQLEEELSKLNSSTVKPGNLQWDQRGNPGNWDHTWNNFGDYEITTTK
ncbi:PREDICTED: arylsulfatase I [Ceratosolen solmsi marchali]|uniref:Arylsulfatase I n=1 Tax=Ceratosolen solmsi marchali TaxID=326594 RepID=A0AAJ6YW55_9HYME|nr:PREDICTED: arylsulfatase I [Ceratosolen solmsi marchali]